MGCCIPLGVADRHGSVVAAIAIDVVSLEQCWVVRGTSPIRGLGVASRTKKKE